MWEGAINIINFIFKIWNYLRERQWSNVSKITYVQSQEYKYQITSQSFHLTTNQREMGSRKVRI